MKVSFGPTTRTPSRPSAGFVYSSHAARCSPTAVFPVPGPPWITSAPSTSRAISSYCSGVFLECLAQRLAHPADHGALLALQAPAPAHAARVGLGRGVERLGRRRAPV